MEPRALRLGVIGNGDAAALVLEDVAKTNRFVPVGAVDTEPRARARFTERFRAETCTSVEELLERFELDGVYIATPTKLHEEHVVACLEAGVHVLVEKPISTSLEAAMRMIRVAKDRGLTLMVCHKRSVDRPIIAMYKIIESGRLGRVRAVHRWHYTDWFYRPRAIDEREPSTGGVVLRQGAHEFDIIRLLAGTRATTLRGTTGDYDRSRPGEGAYYAWVDHEDGVIATSIYGGYGHFWSDEFTKGLGDGRGVGAAKHILEETANSPELEEELKRAEAGSSGSGPSHGVYGFTLVNCEGGDLRPSPRGGVYVYDNGGRRELEVDGDTGTAVIVEEFYRSIALQRPALHDGEWGVCCLEQCLAIRSSSESGAAVSLELQSDLSTQAADELLGERELRLLN